MTAAEWSLGAAGALLMAEEREEADWRDRAACRGASPDLFFSVLPADVKAAKAICAGCPVRQECLEFALHSGEEYGTWGGLSEDELHVARRPRVAVAALPKPPARPLTVVMPDLMADEIARFRAKVTPGGCGLTWGAQIHPEGFGIFRLTRDGVQRSYRAHRIAWKIATGTDPGPDTVIQACGDSACVTPGCLQIEPVSETRRRTARQRKSAA